MALPDGSDTRRIVVSLLADGAVHDSRDDIEPCVAWVLGLTREERYKKSSNGTTELLNHIDIVTGQLTTAYGYIKRLEDRLFRIDQPGRHWLADDPHPDLDERVAAWSGQLRADRAAAAEAAVGAVGIGSTVTVADLATGSEQTWQIVAPADASSKNKKLSPSSPVGQALLGAKARDVVEAKIPAGVRRLQVVAVDR